jgi:hypothetical protein
MENIEEKDASAFKVERLRHVEIQCPPSPSFLATLHVIFI